MRFRVTASNPDDGKMATIAEACLNHPDYDPLILDVIYNIAEGSNSLDSLNPERINRIEQTRNFWREIINKIGESK